MINSEILKLFRFKNKPKKISDSVSPKGRPRIIVRDKDGNIVRDFEDGNLVINSGRNALVRLLNGDYSGKISSIELGEGGTTGDPWTPVDPLATDTGLTTPFSPAVSKAISGFEYGEGDDPTDINFSTIFESYEVNQVVNEAVLKFDDGVVYAKYTFPSVYLRDDKGYSLEIVWNIRFS
jgi:hypothetical protein